jgi:uncharacterized protein (TIGR02466 family)
MSEKYDANLFPVLVRQVKHVLSIEECSKIVANLHVLPLGPHDALAGDAASSFHASIESNRYALDDIERIVPLKQRLLVHTNEYARDYGMKAAEIENSWVNVQRQGSELSFHTHPSSMISGALYLKTDERSSKVAFANPNPYLEMTEVLNLTAYTYKLVTIQPETGSLLLFPSWLRHGSLGKNMSPERIVLSFNAAASRHQPQRS